MREWASRHPWKVFWPLEVMLVLSWQVATSAASAAEAGPVRMSESESSLVEVASGDEREFGLSSAACESGTQDCWYSGIACGSM